MNTIAVKPKTPLTYAPEMTISYIWLTCICAAMITAAAQQMVSPPLITLDIGFVRYDLKYTTRDIENRCAVIRSINRHTEPSIIQQPRKLLDFCIIIYSPQKKHIIPKER